MAGRRAGTASRHHFAANSMVQQPPGEADRRSHHAVRGPLPASPLRWKGRDEEWGFQTDRQNLKIVENPQESQGLCGCANSDSRSATCQSNKAAGGKAASRRVPAALWLPVVVRPGGAQGSGAGSGPPFAGIMVVQPNKKSEFSGTIIVRAIPCFSLSFFFFRPLRMAVRRRVALGPWAGTTGDDDGQDGDGDGDKYGVGRVRGWVRPRARTAVGGDGRGRGWGCGDGNGDVRGRRRSGPQPPRDGDGDGDGNEDGGDGGQDKDGDGDGWVPGQIQTWATAAVGDDGRWR